MTPIPPSPPETPDGWELACTGILRAEFGRRRSRALTNAMIQLAAEEAWMGARVEAASGWRGHIRRWCAALRPTPKWTFGLALAPVLAAAAWYWWPFHPDGSRIWTPDSVCTVYDALNVRWAAGSIQPKVGDVLPSGPLRLEAGVLELEFAREQKVAIEGPAQWELTSRNSLFLENGKLAAYVPRSGVGFTVTTASAKVVDLGTEFGVNVTADACEVGVFAGKVQLTAGRTGISRELTPNMSLVVDRGGTMKPTTLSAAAFPQVGRAIEVNPENHGFDMLDHMRRGGIPTALGFWSGPAYTVSGPTAGIRPFKGPGMLRFFAASPVHAGPSAVPARSEVWQLLDLRPFRELMADGANGKLSALFNRIRGAQTANTFGLTMAAFSGQPQSAGALWWRRNEVALALAEKEIITDDDPATWEKLEITAPLPADADFLIFELRAIGPAAGAGASSPFPDHFADHVIFKLRVPLRASLAVATR